MKIPQLKTIAEAYGISRSRLHALRRDTGLVPADFIDPEIVFNALLETNSSPLRTRLLDPINRIKIIQKLS